MADEVVLVYFRRLDAAIERVTDDLHDFEVRLTQLGDGQTGVSRSVGRPEPRVERLERRLDLVDMPH